MSGGTHCVAYRGALFSFRDPSENCIDHSGSEKEQAECLAIRSLRRMTGWNKAIWRAWSLFYSSRQDASLSSDYLSKAGYMMAAPTHKKEPYRQCESDARIQSSLR